MSQDKNIVLLAREIPQTYLTRRQHLRRKGSIEISSISQSRVHVSHDRSWTVKEDLQGIADPNAEFLWE